VTGKLDFITTTMMYRIILVLSLAMFFVALFLSNQCVTTTSGSCSLEPGMYAILAFFVATALFSGYRLLTQKQEKPDA